jgi:serine phosphatase RsbU (regulator of sigma subunit)
MTAAGDVVAWGSASASLERDCGDVRVVAPFRRGVLVAVIDGLGHGYEAAVAAQEAARVLEAHAGEPVTALVERCHEGLRKTRGAAITLASIDARQSSLEWLAIGNVEGLLLRAGRPGQRTAVVLRGGVVGYQLPALRASALDVSPGDTLVLATDGIRSAFATDLDGRGEPQDIADAVLKEYARGTDDALVLVARYLGASA